MFHFFTVEYAVDINQASKNRAYDLAGKQKEYADLISMRDALVKAHYESDGRLECSRILSTGSKGKGSPKPFPRTKYLEIMEFYKTPTERNANIHFALPAFIADIDCSALTSGKEEVCSGAQANVKQCPRLTEEATKGFLLDVKTFGTNEAVSRRWYGVATANPKLLKDPVSAKDSDKGIFVALKNAIFVPNFGNESQKDLRLAADTVSNKIGDEKKITIFLLLTP